MDVIVREAQIEDYDELCRLFEEVDSLHRDNLPAIFQQSTGPVRDRDYVMGLIADANVALWVANAGEKLVGLAHIFMKTTSPIPFLVPRRYAVIDGFVVAKERRHHGIGRLLAEMAHKWAKARGASGIELNVYEFNREAIAFYERLGYSTLCRKMNLPL